MRIIYLHQYFKRPDESGGTRSYDLSSSFVKNGLSVEMVTTTSNNTGFDGNRWRKEIVDGILVHYLYLPYDNSFSFVRRTWVFFLFLWYSSVKVMKIKGDVVLATSTPLTIGIPALLKKVFHHTPYIFEVRDVWPEAVIAIGAINNKLIQKFLYLLEYLVYKYAEFIVPLSKDMQASILKRYPQYRAKASVVIENIAEIDRFESSETDQRDYIKDSIGFEPSASILYAGTFGKVNKIDYVLDLAFQVLKIDPSIVFLLVGSGAEKDKLVDRSIKLGVYNSNVFFLDPVGKKELPGIYKSVTIGSSFVAPIKELWANSANKFFDTLAAGKPIVINHLGWQADVIREVDIGFVLDSDIDKVNVTDFVSFVKNTALTKAYGLNARNTAVERYSLQTALKKYTTILDSFRSNV